MFKRIGRFFVKLFFWFVLLSVCWVLAYKWLPVPATPLMIIRSAQQLKNNEKVQWKHQWIPLEEISKNLQLAVICSEDQKFTSHHGFDLQAIEKQIDNIATDERLRGASTISQQTAKNAFLWPHR